VTSTITLGTFPDAVAVSPHLCVTDPGDNTLSVVDTATGTAAAAGNSPYQVAVGPDGTSLYVTNESDNTVTVFGVATVPPAPAATSVSPATGTTRGGTAVTITGTNLTGATAVTFGAGHPATAVSCTATSRTDTQPGRRRGNGERAGHHYWRHQRRQRSGPVHLRHPVHVHWLPPARPQPAVHQPQDRGPGHLPAVHPGRQQGPGRHRRRLPHHPPGQLPHPRPLAAAVPAASDGFTYTSLTDVYDYAWKTPTAFHGTCQQLTLKLTDGSTHTATFRF
jgi:hypothetical protein